jgi:CHAT domain-containing protein
MLASLLIVSGCRRHPHPELLYQQATGDFEGGNLPRALDEARAGAFDFRSQPEWAVKFSLLSAEVLIWQGQYKDALALLDAQAPASDELMVRRKSLQSLANTYLQHFDLAERQAMEAEQLAIAKAPARLADVYLSKGMLRTKLGDYPDANQYYAQVVRLSRAQNREFLMLAGLGNLGVSNVWQRHYDKAIDLFNAVAEIGKSRHNLLQLEKASGNLGWCYRKLGNHEKALELYTQAESLAAQAGMPVNQRDWLEAIGSVYLEQHDSASAGPFFQQSLAIARKLGDRASTAMVLTDLALVSVEQGKLDAAEQYNQEALELEDETHSRIWLNSSRETEALIQRGRGNFAGAGKLLRQVIENSGEDVSLCWESEAELAGIYAAQRRDAEAEAQYRRALATVDAARAALGDEEFRLSFLTTAEDFYNSYIDFLISHGRAKDALQVAEHSRARTLAEGLGLTAKMRKDSFQPESIARRVHGVVLAYWLKPVRSYLWVVTPQRVEAIALPPARQIEAVVHAYGKALMGARDVLQTANPNGQQLYSMLVAPAKKRIAHGSRVVIVADGVLHALNFETLLVPGTQLHYWIEDAVVTNTPSLDLLKASEAGHKPGNGRLLLIGNPLASNAEFPPLAQAKLEMQAVRKHFAPAQCTALEGKQATVRAYLSSGSGDFSYIHFVTHGTASRIAPLESSIILSPDGEDYKLYAREITSRPLHAELVTISGCYGAGTRAYAGEGLVGLSWAFLRAGAHNVVAALWEVNDATTPQLMDDMYNRLQDGAAPAEALHSAKLLMLHSQGICRRPSYWGAFQCYTGY